MFGCDTVLQLSFAGLLHKKQVFCSYESWRLPELVLLGKRLETAALVLQESGQVLALVSPKSGYVCVGDDTTFVRDCSVMLQKLSVTISLCVWNQSSPSHKHAWERRPSPVKKSNTDLSLAKNSLTCHFREIIWETKLIHSCWFFLTASFPSKAILYFLFSHSFFYHTLSTGSSIISNNLYFLSLPSYCFVFSS